MKGIMEGSLGDQNQASSERSSEGYDCQRDFFSKANSSGAPGFLNCSSYGRRNLQNLIFLHRAQLGKALHAGLSKGDDANRPSERSKLTEPNMAPKRGWRQVGIEPVMFLYMFAFMITSVIEEAFFVYKACRVDAGLPEDVCRNISQPEYRQNKTHVQKITATFYQWNNIAYHIVPIILSFFLGAWSDQVGRKLPILVGIFGNLYYSSMIVVISLMDSWPLSTVIWLASFPCALTGSSLTVFMAAFSYLADTTTPEQRTLRHTLVEVMYLLPMPLGVALGSYLFHNVVHQSYAIMFVISASLHATAMIATWALLDWKTNESPARTDRVLSLNHVKSSLRALFKRRPQNRHILLFLSLFAMMLYTFQRDERPMLYLYAQYEFNWDIQTFSNFRTFQSSFFVGGLLIGGPILMKLFKLNDTYIIMIGALSHAVARIFFLVGNTSSWLYGGAVAACLGPIVPSVVRSFVSKLVPSSDRGKVFSMLSVTDTAVPMVSAPIYSQVYNAVIGTRPELIFLVTLITQIGVFLIGLTLTISLRSKQITQAVNEDHEDAEEARLN